MKDEFDNLLFVQDLNEFVCYLNEGSSGNIKNKSE